MKKGIAKLSLFCLAAGMVFGNASAVSADEAAAGESSGANLAGTIGFVDLEQADYTVNVRSAADVETGEVVGILKNHDSVVIKKVTGDGWYKIKSGDVKGYVAGYLIATGERAEQIAAETAYRYATVQAPELNVRTSPDAGAEVVCVLKEGDQAEIVAYEGEWLKVCLAADSYGYIAGAYVETDVDYPTGKTIGQYEDEIEGREAAYAAAPQETVSGETASYAAAEETAGSAEQAAPAEPAYTEAAAESSYEPAAAATEVVSGDYVYTKEADQAYTDTASSGDYAQILGNGEPPAESYLTGTEEGYQYYTEDAPAVQETVSEEDYTLVVSSEDGYTEEVYLDDGYTEESYSDGSYTGESYSDGSYTGESYSDGSYTESSYSEESYTQETEAQSSAPAASSTGAEIASYAQQFVGNPYVWGGTSLTNGADCSGFTLAVFAQFGVTLPHFAADQYYCGTAVSLDSLAPGDLIFFSSSGSIDHVAIYIGNGSMVHAANSKSGIIISSIDWMTPVAACRVV